MLRTLLALLGACTLVAAPPGPHTVLIGKQSPRSRRSGFLTVLGNETGVFIWGGGGSGWAVYRGGLLLNLAHPEAAVFALSFLPQFVPEGAPHLPAMIGLAALWAVHEVGYHGLYVWCVGRLRTVLSHAGVRRRLEQVTGGVLLFLGVRLALEG
ncbi:LysE family transporter [Streptomyces sp. NPDC048324]|uniref:LysE family translocator n=1 Tax=Streptomyces sp. NPDC048324 TaxID=3157205 RepID=UPI00341668D2